MSEWLHHFDVQDVFHNDALSTAEKATIISNRLIGKFGNDMDLVDLAEELADQTEADDFDAVWSAIYDWADAKRVWIRTR